MKKKLMTLLLALAMAVSAMAMPAAAADTAGSFRDVADEETLLAVESLRLMGALDGYEDGTFRPEASVTRAEFVKMIGKTTTAFDTPFDDIYENKMDSIKVDITTFTYHFTLESAFSVLSCLIFIYFIFLS